MEGIARFDSPPPNSTPGPDAVTFLAETGIIASKGEARKLIQGGGISINRKKVENAQLAVDSSLLLHGNISWSRKGRKNYYLVTVGLTGPHSCRAPPPAGALPCIFVAARIPRHAVIKTGVVLFSCRMYHRLDRTFSHMSK
jgi:hypothetical protein